MEDKIAEQNLKLKEGDITTAQYIENIYAISQEYNTLGM